MKKLFVVLSILLSFGTIAHADLDKLCDQVSKWTPGQPGPAAELYKGEMTLVDYDFYQKHKTLKNWLLVDARGDKERAENGAFEEVLSLRSGLKADDPNDFYEKTMIEKIQTHTHRKNLKASDLKSYNYILFCNGEKCPKSAAAGCKLRKMGVAASRVNLLNMSYAELKAKGL